MKIISASLLLGAGLLFSQCSSDEKTVVSPKPKIDYDQLDKDAMVRLKPKLLGTWQLSQVYVQAQRFNGGQGKIGIKRDTIFQNFATLTIRPAAVQTGNSANPRYPSFEGDLIFRGKPYPVEFTTIGTADRVATGQGTDAFLFLQSKLAIGSQPASAERTYLEDFGLIDENFTLEMMASEKSMEWRGLNQGVVRINLEKQ